MLKNFSYELPEHRIAKHPRQERSNAKLLHYYKGKINHHTFNDIPELIPENSLLVFNDTRVIPARIHLKKETGANIEIFLLAPLLPSTTHEEVMQTTQKCAWNCMIGNSKKWKIGTSLHLHELSLTATRQKNNQVDFEWENGLSFAELLDKIGEIPLPPYMNRKEELADKERYQTVYSEYEGAVAAPTAGLHFTNEVIEKLTEKGIKTDFLTLHVSAGTFQPIKHEKVTEHPMHNEQIWISKRNIENLIENDSIIAVGTTAMRTLESLYWFGVKLKNGDSDFFIKQNDPYELSPIDKKEALVAILDYMNRLKLEKIGGNTEIFIYPNYQFQLCKGLITNYHLPASTLILLVAAFVGEDWRKIYQSALDNEYNFLSYGDSSFLMP